MKEFVRYVYCRVLTGILDRVLMLIILNYVASKKIVFKTEEH